jgi:hypothetical protein
MGPVARVAAVAVACAGASACTETNVFTCMQDGQCGAEGSVCQADGWCSFVDEACPSGFRYGEHAGDGLGGACVPGADGSTGMDGSGGPGTMPVLDDGPLTGGSSTVALTGSIDDDTSGTPDPSTSGEPPGESGSGSETGATNDPSLVVWYPFDDATNLYADASGNGLDAWCGPRQCPQYEAGVVGGAIVLDGIDDHLHVDHVPILELTADFSIAVWVQVDVAIPDQFHSIAAKPLGADVANSWEVGVPGSMNLYAGAGNLVDFASAQVPLEATGVWHHLTLTWSEDILLLFLDGVEVGSSTTVPIEYDDHPMMIGADIDAEVDDNFLTGKIDDVRIYSRVLEPDEVAALAAERP